MEFFNHIHYKDTGIRDFVTLYKVSLSITLKNLLELNQQSPVQYLISDLGFSILYILYKILT